MAETSVIDVYNRTADWFDKARSRSLMERPYLQALTEGLTTGGTILDLGCGTGEPILAYLLAANYRVTGVDSSKAMIDIARRRFPDCNFLVDDMRNIALAQKFSAIVAWHSLFHLPPIDQRSIFARLAHHLKPGGQLLFTSGTEQGECWSLQKDEKLYHASLNTSEYLRLLVGQGFEIVRHVEKDPQCGQATVWLARHLP